MLQMIIKLMVQKKRLINRILKGYRDWKLHFRNYLTALSVYLTFYKWYNISGYNKIENEMISFRSEKSVKCKFHRVQSVSFVYYFSWSFTLSVEDLVQSLNLALYKTRFEKKLEFHLSLCRDFPDKFLIIISANYR